MTMLITVVLLTLGVSAMCSLFEATLYSTRVAALEAAREGARRARAERMLALKRDIAVPTSTILLLNTLANTAGATIAGMYALESLGAQWVLLFSVAFTISILMLSEILPKTIGATRWKELWPLIVWPLTFLQRVLSPAVWVTRRFAGLFSPRSAGPAVTEDEIVAMIRLGAKAGELTQAENQLLNAIFHFDEVVCRQVMLPRREVVILDQEAGLSDWIAEVQRSKHTRYPVCNGSLDESVGLVHIKDLLGVDPQQSVDRSKLIRPLDRVPETMSISRLLRQMQRSHRHMLAVVDERGTTVGIVTMELILEQIIGPVEDEFDKESPDIVADGEGCYLVRGRTLIDKLNQELGFELYAREVDTVAGLLAEKLSRLPVAGDRVTLDEASMEVLEAAGDGRAPLVRLRRTPQSSEDVADSGQSTS